MAHCRSHIGGISSRRLSSQDGVAADYAAIPARVLAPKPRTLGHVESAALPLSGLSAWQGLFVHGGLQAGERVLILGAAGGVGHFATQLARWRAALPHASATVIEGGMVPLPDGWPDEFAAAVSAFLERNC